MFAALGIYADSNYIFVAALSHVNRLDSILAFGVESDALGNGRRPRVTPYDQ